jgi:glycolate oxidase iron-sulfur subunit
MEAARKLARKNMEVFLKAKVDIITSADSTCGGSFTHEYAQLLPDEPGFAEFSSKFREIHSLILELSVDGNLRELPAKVTYHDSCHLRHTQGVWKEPRQLLRSLAGIDMREMKDSDLCCGFGGFFSLFHGLDSCRVSEEKLDNVLGTGAEELICGSPGCILKLRTEAATRGLPIKVKHTVEFIAERMINK